MNAPSQLRVLRASTRCLPAAGLYGPSCSPSFAYARLAAISAAAPTGSKPSTARYASTLPSTTTSATALEKVGGTANPPHTTRPPPLTLPDRAPETTTFSHIFATGKAYLAFYKTGLKYLFANTKLVRQLNENEPLTRSDLVLRHRWQHDMRRLPLFGLLLLICGEFTPFVVMVFPHVVPYPCRIPKQVESLRKTDEKRRRQAFETAEASETETPAALLITRSLGLAPMRDRLGLLSAVPSLAERVADKRLQFLAQDDALLREAGGAAALETDEVALACTDRGLDVLDKDESELRPLLTRWLEYTKIDCTKSAEPSDKYVHDRIATLLTRRPEEWP